MATIAVGDEVALPQGNRAVLRWIGRIPGRAPIEYAGVEVLGPDAERLGKHSGTYEGHQFFTTARPGTGLFVSYTQLVGANVKSARVETPRATRAAAVAVMSPAAYDTVSPSPRYHKPPLRAHAPPPLHEAADTFAGNTDKASSMAGQLEQLRVECDRLRHERAADRKAFDAKRAEFRDTLRVVNERVEQFAREYEARVEDVRSDYEAKLKSARRSSQLLVPAGGSEVQEQRLALAAMQNKLVAERTEKQQEIDKLKRELAHVRQVTGGAEDLEALVADLFSMEQQLKDMRSKVDQMDVLQRELESARHRNAELELAVKSESRDAQAARPDGVTCDEYARLEQALETRLLRESELEAHNEQLRTEIAQLRTAHGRGSEASASKSPRDSERAHSALQDMESKAPGGSPHTTPLTISEPAQETQMITTPQSISSEPAESAVLATSDSWNLTTDGLEPAKPVPSAPLRASVDTVADESNTSQFADLAAGRKDWCSLCERQGHSAIDCPFI